MYFHVYENVPKPYKCFMIRVRVISFEARLVQFECIYNFSKMGKLHGMGKLNVPTIHKKVYRTNF